MFDRVSQYGVDPMGRGAGNMSALTVPRNFAAVHATAGNEVDDANPEEHPATSGNPLYFMAILFAVIVIAFLAQRTSPALKAETFGVNWFSFVVGGSMSVLFILLIKAVFGRWHVSGITPAVAAI